MDLRVGVQVWIQGLSLGLTAASVSTAFALTVRASGSKLEEVWITDFSCAVCPGSEVYKALVD